MQSNRSRAKLWVLGLVAVLLLSLPFAAAAQTTGGTANATASTAAPTNGITSPKDGAALSGTVEVKGYANSPSFQKWQLDLLPGGDPNAAIFLTLGETAGEFTYSFDTSKLPAGEHALRLRVVRKDSNYDEYVTKFTIGGAAAGGTKTGETTATATATSTGAKPTATPAARGTSTAGGATTSAATSGMGVTTNGLAAPREGQAVNGEFVVRGYANDPNFMKWQLDLLPGGDSNGAIFLALGETSGVFTYTLNTTNYPAGEHVLRLRVVRNDSNYNEYLTKFTIGQAAAGAGAAAGGTTGSAASGSGSTGGGTAAASGTGGTTASGAAGAGAAGAGAATTNGITAPKEGATVSGSVNVTGYASSPSFMKWQLDLLPNGDPNASAFLAFGENPGQFTYTLDTTNLPAGKHALRLRVVRSDSNYDEYITNFTIAK